MADIKSITKIKKRQKISFLWGPNGQKMFIFDEKNEPRLNFISEILDLLPILCKKMGILVVEKETEIQSISS